MIRKLRNYIGEFRAYNRERKQVVQAISCDKNILMARIVRYVHSIEKGLCIESPRAEYGYDKILCLYDWIKQYLSIGDVDKTCVYMAADALNAYCLYHQSKGISTEKTKHVETIAEELLKIKNLDKIDGVYGGVQTIEKEEQTFDTLSIEKLFKTRHSIRQFKKEPVDKELIRKAIELAQSAPSACNRQAVRTYAIDANKFVQSYTGKLQGIGGFLDSCDKIILITGKISAYEQTEYKQFVVSAGIFAGYLSLALHGLGLGACVVQQSLRPTKEWKEFSEKNNIPSDEQVVCLITVGQMDEKTVVPISKRFDTDTILHWL